jgi:ubiquinone/menaquinone biosynthesis C-methylase UbiE
LIEINSPAHATPDTVPPPGGRMPVKFTTRRIETVMDYDASPGRLQLPRALAIPAYLEKTYWWAYIHPKAVRFFERQWLVNLILWGNFASLRDAALDALGSPITGRTLQVACVYGDFSARLAQRIVPGGPLDVVDILPIQLHNLKRKLPAAPVNLIQHDSSALGFAPATYDQTVLFFLLHEMPLDVRRETLAEAVRATKPGGRIVIVDYHGPRRLHPLRYLFRPLLAKLEPFALDLWRNDVAQWLPASVCPEQIEKQTYYGGLYQKLIIHV